MKKFIFTAVGIIIIPIILLLALYLISDPYKVIRPFSLDYCDDTNRDYVSSELFIMNNPTHKYDSFIFGSSRCMGINTYHWLSYLQDGSKPFLFQAWAETITGTAQKISFIDKQGNIIRNALILIDIPSTFDECQLPRATLTIKDYHITGESRLFYQATFFYNFLQKPSQWMAAAKKVSNHSESQFSWDPDTNDYYQSNKYRDNLVAPPLDSLSNCSSRSKEIFLSKVSRQIIQGEADALIDESIVSQLNIIAGIFNKHQTSYKIIITPASCYVNKSINHTDLSILQDIFGASNVFDFSGVNEITKNPYNYSDPLHFDLNAGWKMIETIYNQ